MKKILSLIAVLSLAFSACGNNDDDDVTPIEPQNIIQNVVLLRRRQQQPKQRNTNCRHLKCGIRAKQR